MSLIINHNMLAMNAARNLGTVYSRLANSTQRLSSGLRINSAADDAAGLAVREFMRADIAVLNQGIRNASDAISMIQTAEGALSVIDEKLTRMKELAEQAATGTYTTVQREIMDSEYQAMAAEIDRIANATDFNGIKLLDGSLSTLHNGSGLKVHFGTANDPDEDYYFVRMGDVRATEATGLQVGGGATADIWTASTSGFSSLTSDISGANGEYVSFWYNVSASSAANIQGASSALANKPQHLVGIYEAGQNATLQDLIDTINLGTAARIQLEFASAVGTAIVESAAAADQVINVGNTEVVFAYEGSAGATQVVVDTSGTTDIGATFVTAFNTYTSADTFAVAIDENSVLLFAKTPGVTGNNITFNEVGGNNADYMWLNVQTGSAAAASGNFTMGGLDWITAGYTYSSTTQEYNLQVTGGDRGAYYDVHVLDVDDVLTGAASNWADPLNNFNDTDWTESQDATGSGNWSGADILTQSAAQAALSQLDSAIEEKDKIRASLGALQNRLENTITQVTIQAENLQAAESRISDVDVAQEMTEFTKNNILAQAATAMLAQANTLAQLALSLLGG